MIKHILFVIENRAVPFDTRVWREALAAKDWGFDVSIISRKEPDANLSYEELEGIYIYRHPMPVNASRKLSYIIEYIIALFYELLLAIKVYFKKPFHIIFAGNPPDTISFIALIFKIFGVKYVFDIHDLSPELFLTKNAGKKNIIYKMLLFAEKLSCKLAEAIIITNKSYQEIIRNRHNIDPNKMFIVRNDPKIDEWVLKKVQDKKREGDEKIILYLGSINPQDGVDILLQILYSLVNDLNERNFICYIIGEGQSLQMVKKTTQELNLNNYINFKGYIHDKDKIKEYLYMADVCVEPAPDNGLNRHSTFIKIMEYMMAGKPIVAFDLKETRYSANKAAIFVKSENVKEFAKTIKKLFYEPELRKELGKNGHNRILNILNWSNSLINLQKAYRYIS